jgi:hypothetical protein
MLKGRIGCKGAEAAKAVSAAAQLRLKAAKAAEKDGCLTPQRAPLETFRAHAQRDLATLCKIEIHEVKGQKVRCLRSNNGPAVPG